MGLWARFQKARAIDDYLGRCPELLQARYGYEEHYNGGSYQFLPKPLSMLAQVPLRNSAVPRTGSGFRWYR